MNLKEKARSKVERRVLVVEDREENAAAARTFAERYGLRVTVKSNFLEAQRAVRDPKFSCGIFDLQIPKRKGERPDQQWGKEIGEEAEDFGLPYVFLTSGLHHHGGSPLTELILDGVVMERLVGGKSSPEAWERAYRFLLSIAPRMDEISTSRQYYQKYTGRPYRKGR